MRENSLEEDRSCRGFDAFVTKLSALGDRIIYSTFLGGSGFSAYDIGYSIAVDSSGNAYVTGETFSPNFPTASPLQSAYAGGGDVFVTELDPTGSALVYSTYLGGAGEDIPWRIALDSSRSVYVGGWTNSGNFPTQNPLQGAAGGDYDGFFAKLTPNTTVGSPTVEPIDTSTGTNPVTMSFTDVTQAGETTLTTATTAEPPPSGFQLSDSNTYYELTTTATYSGSITICISYAGLTFPNGMPPQLFHYENGGWMDVTTSVDTDNQIVCGSVTSLSPFGLFAPIYSAAVQPPIGVDGLSVFSAKRGVVPVKFSLFLGNTATCQLPAATISVFRVNDGTQTAVTESEYLMASDSGSNFRIDTASCQYVYNLATKSLGAGTYKVTISIGSGNVGSGTFGLQ